MCRHTEGCKHKIPLFLLKKNKRFVRFWCSGFGFIFLSSCVYVVHEVQRCTNINLAKVEKNKE